jgi:hypothetical protein
LFTRDAVIDIGHFNIGHFLNQGELAIGWLKEECSTATFEGNGANHFAALYTAIEFSEVKALKGLYGSRCRVNELHESKVSSGVTACGGQSYKEPGHFCCAHQDLAAHVKKWKYRTVYKNTFGLTKEA